MKLLIQHISFHDIMPVIRKIQGWLTEREALFLYTAAGINEDKGQIVEIGSWKGKSTTALAAGLTGQGTTRVFAVDPHKGIIKPGQKKHTSTYKTFFKNIKRAGIENRVTPIVRTSNKASQNWNGPISFLFIDGLHTYKNAKEDFLLWERHIINGGMVAFHDAYCGHPEVWMALREILFESPKYNVTGVVGSIIYFVKTTKKFSLRLSIIQLEQKIYMIRWIPKDIRVILLHHLIKLLLFDTVSTMMIKNKYSS